MEGENEAPLQPVRYQIQWTLVLKRCFKYIMEGIVVAIAAKTLPSTVISWPDIVQMGAIATATFAILDYFSPDISAATRWGAGAGIGAKMVGFGG